MNDHIIHVVEFVLHYVAIGIPKILLAGSDICNGKDSDVCSLNNFWIDYVFLCIRVCIDLVLVVF